MQRFGLRDDQWERIKEFLPGREGHVGGNAADNRLFVEAILYRYQTGIPGVTCLRVSATGRSCTRFVVGRVSRIFLFAIRRFIRAPRRALAAPARAPASRRACSPFRARRPSPSRCSAAAHSSSPAAVSDRALLPPRALFSPPRSLSARPRRGGVFALWRPCRSSRSLPASPRSSVLPAWLKELEIGISSVYPATHCPQAVNGDSMPGHLIVNHAISSSHSIRFVNHIVGTMPSVR